MTAQKQRWSFSHHHHSNRCLSRWPFFLPFLNNYAGDDHRGPLLLIVLGVMCKFLIIKSSLKTNAWLLWSMLCWSNKSGNEMLTVSQSIDHMIWLFWSEPMHCNDQNHWLQVIGWGKTEGGSKRSSARRLQELSVINLIFALDKKSPRLQELSVINFILYLIRNWGDSKNSRW